MLSAFALGDRLILLLQNGSKLCDRFCNFFVNDFLAEPSSEETGLYNRIASFWKLGYQAAGRRTIEFVACQELRAQKSDLLGLFQV